jgi:hypothetical protein
MYDFFSFWEKKYNMCCRPYSQRKKFLEKNANVIDTFFYVLQTLFSIKIHIQINLFEGLMIEIKLHFD